MQAAALRPQPSSRGLRDLASGNTNETAADSPEAAQVPNVLTVSTAIELQIAVARGFEHIEIGEHLDLSCLEPIAITATGLDAMLGPIPPEVFTIRVRPLTCAKYAEFVSFNTT